MVAVELDRLFEHQSDQLIHVLALDSSKAEQVLEWQSASETVRSIEKTIDWYRSFYVDSQVITHDQIDQYFSTEPHAADTGKDTACWGTGTTEDDSDNSYSGIPSSSKTVQTVTAPVTDNDISIGYKLDVPSSQKSGSYSGTVVLTETAL